jgi:hypothetical protein
MERAGGGREENGRRPCSGGRAGPASARARSTAVPALAANHGWHVRRGADAWVAHAAATQGDRHHNNASDVIPTQARRGLTELAADERLAEARCARDDVTARSRSWR